MINDRKLFLHFAPDADAVPYAAIEMSLEQAKDLFRHLRRGMVELMVKPDVEQTTVDCFIEPEQIIYAREPMMEERYALAPCE